jgi:hypothetical protein
MIRVAIYLCCLVEKQDIIISFIGEPIATIMKSVFCGHRCVKITRLSKKIEKSRRLSIGKMGKEQLSALLGAPVSKATALSSEGVGIDLKEAANHYKLAADQGDANAQFNYGICLEMGTGVSMDLQKAVHYCKLAADQGHAHAQFNF